MCSWTPKIKNIFKKQNGKAQKTSFLLKYSGARAFQYSSVHVFVSCLYVHVLKIKTAV